MGEKAKWTNVPAKSKVKAVIIMIYTFSVVPARGSSVGVGGTGVGDGVWVGARTLVGAGPAVGDWVGAQVTVTSSQIGPKVSWALTLER